MPFERQHEIPEPRELLQLFPLDFVQFVLWQHIVRRYVLLDALDQSPDPLRESPGVRFGAVEGVVGAVAQEAIDQNALLTALLYAPPRFVIFSGNVGTLEQLQ